jgi:hypothetical protein
MNEFFKTPMGRTFYESTMPRLMRAVEAIADNLSVLVEKTEPSEKTCTRDEDIIRLAAAVLDDGHGVSEQTYELLCTLLKLSEDGQRLLKRVDATDGRYYLPKT